ncbi:MAG: hypothetical protein ABI151_05405 [Chitinophagaceae bacterium]
MQRAEIKNKPIYTMKYALLFCIMLLIQGHNLFAQDSTRKKTIEITSTFKPVLREAAKVNFSSAPPPVDSTKPILNYNIPVQNLNLNYQPTALKPVSLDIDSTNLLKYGNYIKAGVGNVHIPYIDAGFSFGDGRKTAFTVLANQVSAKGSLPFQKTSQTSVSLGGTYKTDKNLEWTGKLGFKAEDYFFYGFQPDTLKFSKAGLRQRFQTFEGKLSFRNINPTKFGLNYNPNLQSSVFSGKNIFSQGSEANTVLNLPLNKTFGKSFGINLGFTADLTTYRPSGKSNIQNNLYYFSPSLLLKTPNLYLSTGLIPSWDNKVFTMLPNIIADITTNDKRFTIQAGWIGYYNKGTYQHFASLNPWILQPGQQLNTRVQERYAGFKGSVFENFTYSAKVGFAQYRNMPLFINDSLDGKTFRTVYSSAMEALQLHAEVGYTKGESFSATAGLTWNQYSKIKDQTRAWGLIPFEIKGSIRWEVMKDIYVKSDLYLFDGAAYQTKTKEARKGDKGIDLNAGMEFKIADQFSLWLQMNNIFNNKYERWNQYPVYGFNLLGGVIFSF